MPNDFIYSNNLLSIAAIARQAWDRFATRLCYKPTRAEAYDKDEIAYLAAAEDHADLERRLARLEHGQRALRSSFGSEPT